MKPQLFKIKLCLLLILACHCSMAQSPAMKTKRVLPAVKSNNDPDVVCRVVDLKTQKKAFELSKNNKILINIYPIKQSNTATNNDLQLKVFFEDNKGPMMGLNDKVDKKSFMQQKANYSNFLKQKNISGINATNIYYVDIDAASMAQADKIAFYFSIKGFHMEYYLLTDRKVQKKPGSPTAMYLQSSLLPKGSHIEKDSSVGKCPPMCSYQVPIFYYKD
jgi:hypothetical protein